MLPIVLARSADRVTVATNIGFAGYVAPLNLPIIDVLALSDPLLARRPAGRPSRVGHYWRLPPEGEGAGWAAASLRRTAVGVYTFSTSLPRLPLV
jgi:hypothetical protein